jgi:hypothetical protein
MIVTSTYTIDEHTQPDGSRFMTDWHTAEDGAVYTYGPYLLPADVSAESALQARRDRLDAKLAERAAAMALTSGTLLPLTKLQFRELFTPTERATIDAFRAGLEALTEEQMPAATKAVIRTGFADFDTAQNIVRPFLPPVLAMLGLFVSLGLITTERRDEIIAAGNA